MTHRSISQLDSIVISVQSQKLLVRRKPQRLPEAGFEAAGWIAFGRAVAQRYGCTSRRLVVRSKEEGSSWLLD